MARCWQMLAALASLLGGATWAGPTILYVSESGDNRIAVYRMDESTGELTRGAAVELPGPPGSLAMSADRGRLYAAVRSVQQFATLAVDRKTGLLSDPVMAPAGCNASYLHVDKTGNWLLAAAYKENLITVSRIKNGVLEGGPVTTLHAGEKPHCVQTDPSNRFALVPHVGAENKVEQLRFDAAAGTLAPNEPPSMAGGEGQRPRHMQFHPNGRWVYLVNEQGKSVTLCDFNAKAGTLTIRQTVPTVPSDWDPSQGNCADIHISADGRFAYASNRGHDSLAIFSIDRNTGELTPRGQTPTEKTPRSFCLMPPDENFVVAGGEGSHRLIVYRRDPQAGTLAPLRTYDCGKAPAWLLGVKYSDD